jgi:hypothetical protein
VQKGDPEREALDRSEGGFITKIHLRAGGGGRPLTFLIAAGQRHEAVVFEALLEQGAVKHPGRGRPKLRPKRVVADKGYSRKIRRYLCRRGITMTIPREQNEQRTGRVQP